MFLPAAVKPLPILFISAGRGSGYFPNGPECFRVGDLVVARKISEI